MTITIHVKGAAPEEVIRGLFAAQEVFDKAGVTPEEATTASFVVEGWDIRGFPRPLPQRNWRSATSGTRRLEGMPRRLAKGSSKKCAKRDFLMVGIPKTRLHICWMTGTWPPSPKTSAAFTERIRPLMRTWYWSAIDSRLSLLWGLSWVADRQL